MSFYLDNYCTAIQFSFLGRSNLPNFAIPMAEKRNKKPRLLKLEGIVFS